MSKHRLFRQSETNSPLDSSASTKELSTVKDVRPADSDLLTVVVDRKVRKPQSPNVADSEENANCDSFDQPLAVTCCDANADSDSDDTIYSNISGFRIPYTFEEDEWILAFVLKDQNIFKVSSVSLWKRLESKKENPKRTFHSLKNRFLRSIKPHIFTRYKHLVKSEVTVERILSKFPELKSSVGKTNTLSQIHIPERKEFSRREHVGTTNGAPKKDERSSQQRRPAVEACPDASNGLGWRESSNLILFDASDSTRKVQIKNKSVEVTVEFKPKKHLESQSDFSKDSSPGIYEKYTKLKEKNQLILCASCGRYNNPKRNIWTNSSTTKSWGPTANSVGERRGLRSARHSYKGLGSSSFKCRKIYESEAALEAALCSRADSKTGKVRKKDANRGEGDQCGDSDEEFVAEYQKLISNDEERLLSKKCLLLNRKIVGVDSHSAASTDSFFVELLPSLETPALSGHSTQPKVCESESSTGALAKNMMKMLGTEVNIEGINKSAVEAFEPRATQNQF